MAHLGKVRVARTEKQANQSIELQLMEPIDNRSDLSEIRLIWMVDEDESVGEENKESK